MPADLAALRDLLSHGGIVVAGASVAGKLAAAGAATRVLATGGTERLVARRVATPRGRLLSVEGGPVEELFSDASAGWATLVWNLAVQRSGESSGYMVAAGGVTLLYSIARGGSSMLLDLPSTPNPGALVVYDTHSVARQSIPLAGRHGSIRILIARRSYALLRRHPATLM